MGETIVVTLIVAVALVYTANHFRKARKGGGCGCGSSCGCGGKCSCEGHGTASKPGCCK